MDYDDWDNQDADIGILCFNQDDDSECLQVPYYNSEILQWHSSLQKHDTIDDDYHHISIPIGHHICIERGINIYLDDIPPGQYHVMVDSDTPPSNYVPLFVDIPSQRTIFLVWNNSFIATYDINQFGVRLYQ